MSNNNLPDLNTLAMLGSMFEGTEFDKKFKETFDKEYKALIANKEVDPVNAFRLANAKATRESLKCLPLMLRLNYLINSFIGKDNENSDEIIDWNLVNEIITTNIEEFDYQSIHKVNSYEELKNLRIEIEFAYADLQPWRTSKCKDCHEDFHMNFSEVLYFAEKGMKLPKRCPACRKARKGCNTLEEKKANVEASIKARKKAKSEEEKLKERLQNSQKEREEYKTSIMSEALKKAGLK